MTLANAAVSRTLHKRFDTADISRESDHSRLIAGLFDLQKHPAVMRITGARVRVPLAPVIAPYKSSNLDTAVMSLVDRWSNQDGAAYGHTRAYAAHLGVGESTVARSFARLTAWGVLQSQTVRRGIKHFTLRRRNPDAIPFVDATPAAYHRGAVLAHTYGWGAWRLYLLLLHRAGRHPGCIDSLPDLAALLGVNRATVTDWSGLLADAGMLVELARPGRVTVRVPLRRPVDRDQLAPLVAALEAHYGLSTPSPQTAAPPSPQTAPEPSPQVAAPKRTAELGTAQRGTDRAAAPAPGLTAGRGGAVVVPAADGMRVRWCGRCELGSRREICPDTGNLTAACPRCSRSATADSLEVWRACPDAKPAQIHAGAPGHPKLPGRGRSRRSGEMGAVSAAFWSALGRVQKQHRQKGD